MSRWRPTTRYYCVAEDYVAWDAALLVDGADQIGDSWVYLVVAHEWGHAMQARLDPSLVAAADELQADCLGAAALFGAAGGRHAGTRRGRRTRADQLADRAGGRDALDHDQLITATRSSGCSGSPSAATVACRPAIDVRQRTRQRGAADEPVRSAATTRSRSRPAARDRR